MAPVRVTEAQGGAQGSNPGQTRQPLLHCSQDTLHHSPGYTKPVQETWEQSTGHLCVLPRPVRTPCAGLTCVSRSHKAGQAGCPGPWSQSHESIPTIAGRAGGQGQLPSGVQPIFEGQFPGHVHPTLQPLPRPVPLWALEWTARVAQCGTGALSTLSRFLGLVIQTVLYILVPKLLHTIFNHGK